MVRDHVIRALGKAFHPPCFTCVTCARCIGDESFALDSQNQVYCVADFYRWEGGLGLGERGRWGRARAGRGPPAWGGGAPAGQRVLPLLCREKPSSSQVLHIIHGASAGGDSL